VTTAFGTKMPCAHHGKMLKGVALEGDVLCEVGCQDVVPHVADALALLVRKAANAS
jgi:hypothetical protein